MMLINFDRRYGGKRAFTLNLIASFQMRLPATRDLCSINWSRVERFVFICKGNICRSAYAQAKAKALGLLSVSAGLEATPGMPADDKALRHGAMRRVPLDDHRASSLTDLSMGPGDLVVCMELPQALALRDKLFGVTAQVTLLGLWSRPRRPWLFDPYGLDDAYWRNCLDIIDSGIDKMAQLHSRRSS